MALCKKPKEDNTFPSIPEDMRAFIENTYYDPIFAMNRNPISNLYEDLKEISESKGWLKVPSYDTVLRYIEYVKELDGDGAYDLVSKGVSYWKNKHMIKRPRDTKSPQILEVVQGDGHTFDCFVSVKRADGTIQAIRPILVSWLDTRSKVVIGWVICENPDAQIVKQSILNMIYKKKNPELPYGVPKCLLIDNGKEFTAKSLTGIPRSQRFCFDEDMEGFFKSVGILHDMRSLPYQPWSKAQIERYHGTINTGFTKRINSYVGSLTGKSTDDKVSKNIKQMLEKGELLTIEEFAQQFENWIVQKYHKRKHRGLVDQGEEITIPIDLFNTDDKYYKAAPPMDYAISLLMKGDIRVVSDMGIQRTIEGRKIYYTHTKLMAYAGKKVTFKYFPEDITKVLVYDEDGKRICEAVAQDLLRIAPQLSESGLTEHVKDQKRHERSVKDTVKKRRMTYEQRKELNYEDSGKKVVSPEIAENKGKNDKVISLPRSQRYKEDKQAKKKDALTQTKTDSQSNLGEANEYRNRIGEEVYAMLTSR